jgi:hypothetical protein
MNMLDIVWDDQEGLALPEGKVAGHVDHIVYALTHGDRNIPLVIGTALLLHEIRLRVKLGQINHQAVSIMYKNQANSPCMYQVIYVDKNGQLDSWPEGLADRSETVIAKLLNWDASFPLTHKEI